MRWKNGIRGHWFRHPLRPFGVVKGTERRPLLLRCIIADSTA